MEAMRPALLLLLPFVLTGCKGAPADPIVGTWALGGSSIRFAPDGTYVAKVGAPSVAGTWTEKDRTLVLVPRTVGGKPVAEATALKPQIGGLPPGMRMQAERAAQELGTTRTLLLSADGKTLTSDEGSWAGMAMTKPEGAGSRR